MTTTQLLVSAKQVVNGLLEIAADVYNNPVARMCIVWLVTGKLPTLTEALKRIPANPKAASTMTAEEGLRRCRELGLQGPAGYLDLPPELVDSIWNGMGPDSWIASVRALVDRMAACVFLCSLPHDLWYSYVFNDGRRETYDAVDRQWGFNSATLVKAASVGKSWWQRRQIEFCAALVHQALRVGGWQAWKDAYARITHAE